MSTLPVGSLPSGTHPSSATRAVVSTRDGQSCWLCHRGPPELLTVAHQIASVNSAQVSFICRVVSCRTALNGPPVRIVQAVQYHPDTHCVAHTPGEFDSTLWPVSQRL